jgi:hypothetical protein
MSPPDSPDPKLLPLHLLPDDPETLGVVKRRPGRPKKVRPAPVFEQHEYDAQVAEQRQAHFDSDPLLATLKEGDPSGDVIHQALLGLATESAVLLFDREQAELQGRDIALIATRRIEALSKMASIILTTQRLGVTDLLASPSTTRKIVAAWVQEVGAIVREVVPEYADALMVGYEARLRQDPELGGDGFPGTTR